MAEGHPLPADNCWIIPLPFLLPAIFPTILPCHPLWLAISHLFPTIPLVPPPSLLLHIFVVVIIDHCYLTVVFKCEHLLFI